MKDKREAIKKHIKYSGVIVIIIAIFSIGYMAGGGKLEASAYASNGIVNSNTLNEVKQILESKFINWNSSSTLPTDKELEYGIIKGYVDAYKDPYTVFMPPQEAKSFAENVTGHFGGIGAQIGNKDGFVTVIAPLKDSPSMKAGIKTGDFIVSVDGKDIKGMSVDEAVSLIRGEIGTKVTLSVLREGEPKQLEITIVRGEVKVPTVDTRSQDGVFILNLYNFNADSADLFRKSISEYMATNSQRLIIDLRGNPGGYLEAAVNIASMFVPAGKSVVTEKSADVNKTKDHVSKGFNMLRDKPGTKIVILADGGSASAAEIVAGALKDYGYATIIGEKTFGKGSVQELVELPGGSSVKVTVAKWYTPNGVNISASGILPNIEVKASSTAKNAKGELRDLALEEAIRYLNSK